MSSQPAGMPRASGTRALRSRQRGAATLVIVMLLFFVISLTAAYTARNLIFEQRTSANQYRATQAVEAAEAGLEWAAAMLNGGRIDDACEPTADPTRTTFRERYFEPIDPVSGLLVHRNQVGGDFLWAACQFDGTRWRCSCPAAGLPALAAPVGAGPFPAFGLRFSLITSKPGITRIEVNGCSAFDLTCVTKVNVGLLPSLCRATICSLLALHNGLRLIPAAPLTAQGQLDGTALTVVNTDLASGGVTVHTGDPLVMAGAMLVGPSGTPPEQTIADNDSRLATLVPETPDCTLCMFSSVFGTRPSLYAEQPALVSIDCSATCTAAQVNAVIALNPDRMIRLTGAGGLTLSGATDIGNALAPVVLWAQDGPVNLSGGYTGSVTGLVFARTATLAAGEIRGAIVSSGNITGNGAQVSYDPAALMRLKQTTGSFVRVPGSWRDYP